RLERAVRVFRALHFDRAAAREAGARVVEARRGRRGELRGAHRGRDRRTRAGDGAERATELDLLLLVLRLFDLALLGLDGAVGVGRALDLHGHAVLEIRERRRRGASVIGDVGVIAGREDRRTVSLDGLAVDGERERGGRPGQPGDDTLDLGLVLHF